LRDRAVDDLAWDLDRPAMGPNGLTELANHQRDRLAEEGVRRDEALDGTYSGLSVPVQTRALIRAQYEHTRRALADEISHPSAKTHEEGRKATERLVLVLDAVIRGTGVQDARHSSQRLADVADELASALLQAQKGAPA